ncbi:MAG TPA: hypothetical protein DCX08_10645 [Porticoccaceae bacterium]|nr:hypothetical protein [Porticoccaceae bacterium]
MIDKKLQSWKVLPWWLRVNMLGIRKKRTVLWCEFIMIFTGFTYGILLQDSSTAAIMFFGVYVTSWLVKYGDKHHVW